MLKKFLILLASLFLTLPAFSGEFEEALRTHKKVFVYLYTPECGYCVKFNPIYEKIVQKYSNDCKFLKINANTPYGNNLNRSFHTFYVPNVVLVNSEKQTLQRVVPTCLLDVACIRDAVTKFIEK